MVQFRLSVAFVLAAAAVAPVIAHPLGESDHPHPHRGARGMEPMGGEKFGRGRRIEGFHHEDHEGRERFHHGDHEGREGFHHEGHERRVGFHIHGGSVGGVPHGHDFQTQPSDGGLDSNGPPKEGDVHPHVSAIRSTAKFVTREFDDMFERDFENTGSGDRPMHRHIGTVQVSRFPLGRRPFSRSPRLPLIPNIPGLQLGHGPVINRPSRLSFGPGPVVRKTPASGPEVAAREYTGAEDIFEREFEDAELDARDFDELYLD